MTLMSKKSLLGSLLALFGLVAGTASAAPVYCADGQDVLQTKNYMAVDDSQVSSCLLSGTGNLTGNPANDVFLNSTAGEDYYLASKSDESNPFNIIFDGTDMVWAFDDTFWDTNTSGAIAFKFGTGNNPDEWFVYELVPGVSSGSFQFFNVFGQGGGISHINLYGVPEPGTLALFGLGLVAVGLRRRRVA